MRTFRLRSGGGAAAAAVAAALLVLAGSAREARAICDEAVPSGPGMLQGGFFPFEPGGPPFVCVKPRAVMTPVYVVDALMGTVAVVKGARGAWPGLRWQVAAGLLGGVEMLAGAVVVYGVAAARFDEMGNLQEGVEKKWLVHGALMLGAGTALLGTAVLSAVLGKPPAEAKVALAPLVTKSGGGLLLTLRY